ncbi:MAG: sulfur oxidation c-type cytochrome SoxX [Hyphomicrobiaceae bacterium]
MAVVLAATAIAMSSTTLVLSDSPQRSVGDYAVTGDAIVELLTPEAGNATRGRRIVLDREAGNCLICHKVPEPAEPFQGDLGPDLGGIGKRLTAGRIRLRLVDESRLNPLTLMPPYYRVQGLNRVAARYRGKPVLTAQEIEDVVAYLGTLTQ